MSTLINIFCSYILKLLVHNHYIVKYTLPILTYKHANLKIMFRRLQMMYNTDILNTLYVHQMVLHNLTCKMGCHWNKETCQHVDMATCHTNSFTWSWCRSYSSFSLYTIFRLINPRIWFPFAAAIPHCSDTFISALIVNPLDQRMTRSRFPSVDPLTTAACYWSVLGCPRDLTFCRSWHKRPFYATVH